MDLKEELRKLLLEGFKQRASDVHLHPDLPPYTRVDGFIQPMKSEAVIPKNKLVGMLTSLLDEGQRRFFLQNKVIDFAYELTGSCRYRVNVFLENKGLSAVFRVIPNAMFTTDDLMIPSAVISLLKYRAGLILVTGPTGAGKSTTLAAIIDHLNNHKNYHVVTLEYPIEFVYKNNTCSITQREVGGDTPSFTKALIDVARQDPDVVLIGEMRDKETIEQALNLAESGKLVFATLHTVNANQTAERIVNVFPAEEQNQRRTQFASVIRAVISQMLLPRIDKEGRIAAFEVLIATSAVKNCIREGKTHQLGSYIESGKEVGMQTLALGIEKLAGKRLIDPQVARNYISGINLDKK